MRHIALPLLRPTAGWRNSPRQPMPRKQSEIAKSLVAKGFRTRDGDHAYFTYYSKAGKKTAVFTKTGHGAREIDDSLLGRMARQCKLSRADFEQLITCPLDRDRDESKLVAQRAVEAQSA